MSSTAPQQDTRPGAGPVLLYDGSCAFCNWTLQLVLQHDRRSTLRFAALESPFARRIVERVPALAGVDSVVWVEVDVNGMPRAAAVRSAAVLRLARYLGGWWALLLAAQVVPARLRDRAYDLVARHRQRILRSDRCVVPTPDQKRRFLDSV